MDIFGSSTQPAAEQAPVALGNLAVSTSVLGLPRSIVYGTNRVGANLLWYGNFQAIAVITANASASGGGKGAPPQQNTSTTTYTYTAAMAMGLCEGPISGIGTIWQDKVQTTAGALGLSLFDGAIGQTPWGFLTTNYPAQAIGYSGLAYVANSALGLGTNASMPNLSFEVSGIALFAGSLDSDPSAFMADWLTNGTYGALFPSPYVGDWSQFQNYVLANGMLMSPVIDQQTEIRQEMTDMAQLCNSEFVWSPSTGLTIVPYGDAVVTGNGHTFTPNLTPLFDLADDDFMPGTGTGGDPVVCTRSSPADADNSFSLEIVNRANEYNTENATAQDQDAIDRYGLRTASVIQAHAVTSPALGRLCIELIKNRSVYQRNTYAFTLGWKYCVLDPMDLVTITDPGLDLFRQLVRILTMDEDDNGLIAVTAEEVNVGTASPPAYGTPAGARYSVNFNADPGPTNAPIFFEPPDALAGGLVVWAAVSGGPLWGGCDVYLSTDNATYRRMGRINAPARMGTLTASLPVGLPVDSVNTCAVDLSASEVDLASGTAADALALLTLCLVDQELLAYQTATFTGTRRFALTGLVRGAYGSTIAAHPAAAPFARLDDAIFAIPFDVGQIGKPIWVKFVSFNIYGAGLQDIALVTATSYAPTGAALFSALPALQNLTSAYIANLTQLQWSATSDFRAVDYEVRFGPVFGAAQIIGYTPNTNFNLQGNDGTYWVVPHTTSLGIDVYGTPASIAVAGATLVRNVVKSFDEAALGWTGAITGALSLVGGELVTTAGVNSGIYTAPETVDTGRVMASFVTVNIASQGVPLHGDFLGTPDFLGISDLVGGALAANVVVTPQIRIAPASGIYGAWMNFQPGQYLARYFQVRAIVASIDAETVAIVTGFTWNVDMPDRVDQYQNLAAGSGGLAITYRPLGSAVDAPFNGGPGGSIGTPGLPSIQVTWQNTSGDTLVISAETLSGCTIQIKNGGTGVARTLRTVTVQGY